MSTAIDVRANFLLKALTQGASESWHDKLEMVELPLGLALHEPNAVSRDVYFPVTAVVSLLYVLADGHTAETAVIGREGVVGISRFMGDSMIPSRAVVQCAGTAIRMDAAFLRQEIMRKGNAAFLLLQFTQALIVQMSQTAVCNRHHAVEQHLCRWILLMLDRHAGREIAMTHELIASMLGVRRESVSIAAARLQKKGLMSYWRGLITQIDRPAMERQVCECYGVIRSAYDRLLPALDETANHPRSSRSMRHDAQRLEFLRASGILDTPPERVYDDIARQAAQVVAMPFAMVNFLDDRRDWFKASVGFTATESPSETSFCEVFFATNDNTVLVENTGVHARFASHPFVRGIPFIRSYAAVRLVAGGHTVGTLCVYDVRERRLDIDQVRALESLAEAAVEAFEAGVPV